MYYISLPNLSSWITWAGTNVSVRINNTTHPVPLPSGQALFSRHTALALKPSNLISMHILREDVTEKNILLWALPKLHFLPTARNLDNFFTFVFAPKVANQFLHGHHPATHYSGTSFPFQECQNQFGQAPLPSPRGRVFFSGTSSQTIIITTFLPCLLWC